MVTPTRSAPASSRRRTAGASRVAASCVRAQAGWPAVDTRTRSAKTAFAAKDRPESAPSESRARAARLSGTNATCGIAMRDTLHRPTAIANTLQRAQREQHGEHRQRAGRAHADTDQTQRRKQQREAGEIRVK